MIEKSERLDIQSELRDKLLPLCRLKYGEVWEDEEKGHKVGVLDATKIEDVNKIMDNNKAVLTLNDPPYNIQVGNVNTQAISKKKLDEYLEFSKKWVENTINILDKNASFYVWLGADQSDGFQPLPDFMILMRDFKELKARSFITMRNQRGYGTQKNWMAVRQELLYYVKGSPIFNVEAEYTDIPKILKGYYKKVNGKVTENLERSKSQFIRAGNVWIS